MLESSVPAKENQMLQKPLIYIKLFSPIPEIICSKY